MNRGCWFFAPFGATSRDTRAALVAVASARRARDAPPPSTRDAPFASSRPRASGARVGSRVSSPVVRLDGRGRVFLERRDGGVPRLRALARVQPPRLLRPGSFPGGTGGRRGDVRVRLQRRRRVRRRGPLRVLPRRGRVPPRRVVEPRHDSTVRDRSRLGRRPRRHRHRLPRLRVPRPLLLRRRVRRPRRRQMRLDGPLVRRRRRVLRPDVIRVASEMFGARALAALAVAQTACVAETNPGACDAATQCAWSDADSRCASDPIGTLRVSARSTTARAFLEAVDECRRGDARPKTRAPTSETTRWDACGDANQHPRTSSRRNTAATAATEAADGGATTRTTPPTNETRRRVILRTRCSRRGRRPRWVSAAATGSARRFNRSSSCSRGARRRERTRRGATRRRRARCRPRAGRRRSGGVDVRPRSLRGGRNVSSVARRGPARGGQPRVRDGRGHEGSVRGGIHGRGRGGKSVQRRGRGRGRGRGVSLDRGARGGVLGGDVRGCVFRRRRAVRGVRQSSQEKGRGRVRSHAGMDARVRPAVAQTCGSRVYDLVGRRRRRPRRRRRVKDARDSLEKAVRFSPILCPGPYTSRALDIAADPRVGSPVGRDVLDGFRPAPRVRRRRQVRRASFPLSTAPPCSQETFATCNPQPG